MRVGDAARGDGASEPVAIRTSGVFDPMAGAFGASVVNFGCKRGSDNPRARGAASAATGFQPVCVAT